MIGSRVIVPDARGSRSRAAASPRARRRGDLCLVSSTIPSGTGMMAIGPQHLRRVGQGFVNLLPINMGF